MSRNPDEDSTTPVSQAHEALGHACGQATTSAGATEKQGRTGSASKTAVRGLAPEVLHASLRACLPTPQRDTIHIGSITELTPGLSGSRVFRIQLATTASVGASGAPQAGRQ